ncbi:MAG: hypothetical protein J6P98_07690, partial [Clostridia bacterium]|nr:hypothetical protein [Clostridia bacterium]
NTNGYEKLDVEGKEVFVRFSEYSTVALWVEDGYLFHLSSSVIMDTETLLSLIESVKPVD